MMNQANHQNNFPTNSVTHQEDRDDVVAPIDFEVKWEGEIEDIEGSYQFASDTYKVGEDTFFTYNTIRDLAHLNDLLRHCDKARVKVVEEFVGLGLQALALESETNDPAGKSITVALKKDNGPINFDVRPCLLIHEYGHNADATDVTDISHPDWDHRYGETDPKATTVNIMNYKNSSDSNELNRSEGIQYLNEESD